MRRIRLCLRRLLQDELDEEAVGLFEEDRVRFVLRACRGGCVVRVCDPMGVSGGRGRVKPTSSTPAADGPLVELMNNAEIPSFNSNKNIPQLELPSSRRRQQQAPSAKGHGHGHGQANGTGGGGKQAARPAHKKQLRAKDASYSESVIQDFRKEEIPTELAQQYDLQDIVGIGTTSKVYKCRRRARAEVFACKVRAVPRPALCGVGCRTGGSRDWTDHHTLAPGD